MDCGNRAEPRRDATKGVTPQIHSAEQRRAHSRSCWEGTPDPNHGAPTERWEGAPGLPITGAIPRSVARRWEVERSSWPGGSTQRSQWPLLLGVGRRLLEDVAGTVEEDPVEEEGGLEPGVDGGADSWCAGRPALLKLTVQGRQVGVDYRAGEVLGHEVGGIGSPR